MAKKYIITYNSSGSINTCFEIDVPEVIEQVKDVIKPLTADVIKPIRKRGSK